MGGGAGEGSEWQLLAMGKGGKPGLAPRLSAQDARLVVAELWTQVQNKAVATQDAMRPQQTPVLTATVRRRPGD